MFDKPLATIDHPDMQSMLSIMPDEEVPGDVTHNPDGSVTLSDMSDAPAKPLDTLAHGENLAAHMDEGELSRIGMMVIDDFEDDDQSRAKWRPGLPGHIKRRGH